MARSFENAWKKEIGKHVKQIREEQGKSQQLVADLMGTDRANLSRIEAGQKGMSLVTAIQLCNVLGVTVNDICGELNTSETD